MGRRASAPSGGAVNGESRSRASWFRARAKNVLKALSARRVEQLWSARPSGTACPCRRRCTFPTRKRTCCSQLAQPIDQRRRTEFLQAVAAEIEANGHTNGAGVGPGLVHQIGRTLQRRFWHPPAETEAVEPRHDGPKASAGR